MEYYMIYLNGCLKEGILKLTSRQQSLACKNYIKDVEACCERSKSVQSVKILTPLNEAHYSS